MYTATLDEFKIKQDELFRQAEQDRLVRSVKRSSTRPTGLIQKIAKVFVQVLSL